MRGCAGLWLCAVLVCVLAGSLLKAAVRVRHSRKEAGGGVLVFCGAVQELEESQL